MGPVGISKKWGKSGRTHTYAPHHSLYLIYILTNCATWVYSKNNPSTPVAATNSDEQDGMVQKMTPSPRKNQAALLSAKAALAQLCSQAERFKSCPELLAKAKAGEAAAFGSLYDQNFNTIYSYVAFCTNHPEVAETVVKETFLCALKHITQACTDGQSYAAWLVSVARGILCRRRLNSFPSPCLHDGDSEETAAMLRAIKKLSPTQQEAFIMLHALHLSVADIAWILGMSEPEINNRLLDALQNLEMRAA
jgi:RNA polymerase sigma-70 factor (ECF subfamily)